jgi:hypothetical protein
VRRPPAKSLPFLGRPPGDDQPYREYINRPGEFFRRILKIDYLWDKQVEAVERLLIPPFRSQCPAANEVGKTFIAACALPSRR